MKEISEWKKDLDQERNEKDKFFLRGLQSPLPIEDQTRFRGLIYYDLDPDYRFELELHEHRDKKVQQIQDSGGNARNLLQFGEFRIKIGNEECILQAYKINPQDERLFIPFKDITNAKETYGAGRYLDLHYERDYTPEGRWILDFNRAYNPWCAYSKDYLCPFVPAENWLKVAIYAGEKNYPQEKKQDES